MKSNDVDCHTLHSLKRTESELRLLHGNGRALWNLDNRMGTFERDSNEENVDATVQRNDTDDVKQAGNDGECEILEYIINTVNWNSLQLRLKDVLKDISTSAAFN